ncbi:MAG: ABC transporter ATP-binding protein [Vicinamibacterales bacterium]
MPEPTVVFERVWKKFRRGERHDSLRDLVAAIVSRPFARRATSELAEQEFWALRDVSFEVRPGEALGIIGPNGAGKSTALKLLTRIMRPTRGRCEVHGRVGALIEVAAGFHPELTGRENVSLQGAIMGMTPEEVARRFDAIVDFAGIPDFIDTPVKRYSSGMNARLGFAIAAQSDPDVLLIDEALAVGDMSFQQKCYDYLRTVRQSGAAVVFVSHNLQAVASISDRVLLLRPQAEPLVGTVAEMLSAYRSPETQSGDRRASLVRALLAAEGDDADATIVEPSTQLVLEAAVRAEGALPRCCVGFEVVRQDGLVVFDGSPMLEGTPSADLPAGAVLTMQVRFQANLLRGLYTINLHLIDERRRWRPVRLGSVATFAVEERSRVQGVAELQPVYRVVWAS